jgi:hypothetical protein
MRDNGIESVKENGPTLAIEDLTMVDVGWEIRD